MYSKDASSFKLTPKLEAAGWLSFDDNICIPLPDFCGEYKYLMVKRKEFKNKNAYEYSFVKEANETKQKGKILRDIPTLYELKVMGTTLDSDGFPNIGTDFHNALNTAFDYKDIRHDDWKEYTTKIITLMQAEDCLQILKNENYKVPKRVKPAKEDTVTPSDETYITSLFSERKHIGKARQGLAKFIKSEYDLILRKNSHELYILDFGTNCYTQVNFDELFVLVSNGLGEGLINEDDLNEAIKYISDRRDPEHNIVKFKNCLFDMDKLEPIHVEKPVFTQVESAYNYNPDAKSRIVKEFLHTSLKNKDESKTERNIKGIKQLVGYLFTSGNKLNVLPLIIGISGGGKSVFANILNAIFGEDKIADLKLQQIEKDPHATSSLINKHLNIIQDSDASTINNNSLIKQLTGNDPLQVNPKYVHPFVLPPEEVPKSILIGNNIPKFTKLEQALIERFLIIEFKVKFRGTERENPNLLNEILSNPEEIEWLIYESLKEYKSMTKNGDDFVLRENGDETRKLVNKHQNPLSYIFSQLITGFSDTNDAYVYTQDLKSVIKYYAKEEGTDLTLNPKGDIPSKQMMSVIRNEFDLWDNTYTTQTYKGKRYYPCLIPNELYRYILENKLDNN